MSITVKRVYEEPAASDGVRVLVDRLWPRGLSKERARIDRWTKEIAPSDALRKWFAQDAGRWDGFRQRYREELDTNREALGELIALCRQRPVTLLFAAKDEAHNNAVVLREWLEGQSPPRKH